MAIVWLVWMNRPVWALRWPCVVDGAIILQEVNKSFLYGSGQAEGLCCLFCLPFFNFFYSLLPQVMTLMCNHQCEHKKRTRTQKQSNESSLHTWQLIDWICRYRQSAQVVTLPTVGSLYLLLALWLFLKTKVPHMIIFYWSEVHFVCVLGGGGGGGGQYYVPKLISSQKSKTFDCPAFRKQSKTHRRFIIWMLFGGQKQNKTHCV